MSEEPSERILKDWVWATSEGRHELIGSVCSCGEWSAQCGHDIPRQWADHIQANR